MHRPARMLAIALAVATAVAFGGPAVAAAPEERAVAEAEARALDADIVRALEAGDPQRAVELATRQLALREAISPEPSLPLATTLSYLALAHRNLDEFAIAQGHARRALAITLELRGPDALDTATALTNLAGILRERGDALAAEHALQRALEIRTQALGTDHPSLAQSYNNLASLRMQQGDAVAAEELYAEALRIVVAVLGPRHDNALKARQNLARALAERGKDEAALTELADVERALRAADPVVASRLADVIAQRAAIDEEHGRDGPAAQALLEAIELRANVSTDPQVEVIAAEIALARIRARQGDARTARRLHTRTVESASALVGEAHPLTLQARAAAADFALGRNDHEGAIELLEPATAAYVQARQRAAEGLRSATAPLASPFDRLAVAYGRTRDFVRAWEAAERGRGLLLDAPARSGTGDAAPVLPRLLHQLDATTAAAGWLRVENEAGNVARVVWVARAGRPLQWIELTHEDAAAHALREATRVAPDLFAADDLRAIDQLAHEVYTAYFAPIESQLAGVDRLVVVPAGALLDLPIGMLIDDGGRTLDERFTLELTPSLRTWLQDGRPPTRRSKARTVLALGDPPFRSEHLAPAKPARGPRSRAAVDLARLPRLVSTRAEATVARRHFAKGELLLGRDASEARLRVLAREDRLRDFDVLHLATHALVDLERPGLSMLALSQLDLPEPSRSLTDEGPLDDGALTVDEILAEWKLDADLVTLSACNTGMGRPTAGDGLLGFAQAFLLVGARSLVLSLWEVDDDATALLMERFYTALERDPGRVRPADALRTARQQLRSFTDAKGQRPYAHPYYWAPFVVVSVR